MRILTTTDAVQSPGPAMERPATRTWSDWLNWAFVAFNSVRLFTYFPTMWAIHASRDSSQHSLVTWLAWVGSNATMAAWLYDHNGRRINKAILVTASNATMCLATSGLVLFYR